MICLFLTIWQQRDYTLKPITSNCLLQWKSTSWCSHSAAEPKVQLWPGMLSIFSGKTWEYYDSNVSLRPSYFSKAVGTHFFDYEVDVEVLKDFLAFFLSWCNTVKVLCSFKHKELNIVQELWIFDSFWCLFLSLWHAGKAPSLCSRTSWVTN